MRLIKITAFIFLFSFAAFAQMRQAPDFRAVDLDGNTVELSALKGKVVLLTFWSSRCEICRVEIPKLNRIAERFRKDRRVVFLGVTPEVPAQLNKFLPRNPFDVNIVPNGFGIILRYGDKDREGYITMGYPAYFVINRRGQIEHKSSGYDRTPILDIHLSRLSAAK